MRVHEAGKIRLDDILDVSGVGSALESQAVTILKSENIREELRAVARPLMIETAAYVAAAVAIVLVLIPRR